MKSFIDIIPYLLDWGRFVKAYSVLTILHRDATMVNLIEAFSCVKVIQRFVVSIGQIDGLLDEPVWKILVL